VGEKVRIMLVDDHEDVRRGLAALISAEEDLEVAILRVLTDADLRRRLREQGLLRAGDFSWERAARETSRVYETVAGAGGS